MIEFLSSLWNPKEPLDWFFSLILGSMFAALVGAVISLIFMAAIAIGDLL